MSDSIIAGADIGGSHITAALVDLQSRSVLKDTLVRVHVNSHGTVEQIIESWATAVEKVFSNHAAEIKKIGIAMPNPVDYETGISYIKGIDKYDALYGLNIKELLAVRLKINASEILMKNDAGCFLQGEAFGGAAKEFNNAIGLTVGTGIGTARYHNNVAEDADLWHSPFRDSMAEDYLSSRWFVKRYTELSGTAVKDVKELAGLYESDRKVQAVFEEFAENLSQFLVTFVALDNPEVIIIGGNVCKASALFLPEVERLLLKKGIKVPIRKAILGEEAAIIGAASVWYQKKNHTQTS